MSLHTDGPGEATGTEERPGATGSSAGGHVDRSDRSDLSDRTWHSQEEADAPAPDGAPGDGGQAAAGPAVREPLGVAVQHDVRIPVAVALVCAVLTVAWLNRALESASLLDWLWCAVPAAVGVLMLAVLRDARAPLLMADEQGVRVRRGVTWHGVLWRDVEQVELRAPARLRDGEVEVRTLAGGDSRSFRVPLGWGTRVVQDGLTGNLVDDLDTLAAGQAPVRVLSRGPEPVRTDDEHDAADHDEAPASHPADPPTETEEAPAARVAPWPAAGPVTESVADPVAGPPSRPGVTAEPVQESIEVLAVASADTDGALPEQRAPESVDPGDPAGPPVVTRPARRARRSEVVRQTVRRLPEPAVPAQRAEPMVVARVDDLAPAPTPVAEPVIGPVVAAARQRARLTIDTLSERTRIRPHVLECIEVDDFEACGGDFYARGHLRTLARVFGLDAEELVRSYDEHYARPEIEAREVFEAELATGMGGGVRTAASGPRWSMLAAAVLVLVGVWGSTRFLAEEPQELLSPVPAIADTVDLANGEDTGAAPQEPTSGLAAISVRTQDAPSQVVIRDASGRILFAGRLGEGQSQRVIGTAPFDVTAGNGQAVRVTYLGEDRGSVGDADTPDNRRFG